MRYHLNESLLNEARKVLKNRKNIFWIVGGSCSGKSTVGKTIASKFKMLYYDLDEYIFDKYIRRYSKELHPASREWFFAENPLNWALSFSSWEENNEFNVALTVEQLSLFSEDVQEIDRDKAILVDGGITNPAILARVLDAHQICCIKIEDDLCIRIWEDCKERQPMKEMILQLPSPQEKWSKFLDTNVLMNRQIETECRENGIKILYRKDKTTVDDMANEISTLFLKVITEITGKVLIELIRMNYYKISTKLFLNSP
ncbi:shikimate kinase [Alkaliphilus serpentinus]|uniref:shikimate kinase n=1 Tax=Alkaliphilus serpentinus TaxID=1482731 RepID=UPI00186588A5|nr:shikimate kinase [Alkaliphilus serpentinus]